MADGLKACWQYFLVGKNYFFLFYMYWQAEGLLAEFFVAKDYLVFLASQDALEVMYVSE